MSYFNTTAAWSTSGVKTITVGFQPTSMRVTVGQKFGTTQNFSHLSLGSGEPAFSHVDSTFQDGTGGKTITDDTKIVSHYERVSGTITEVLAASIDSFTATQAKLNITTPNVNYNLYIEVWG